MGVDAVVEFGIRLVKEYPDTWRMLQPAELRALNAMLFPQNLLYHHPGIKTAELAPIYKLKSVSSDTSNHYVTYVGQNWNQLLEELAGWHTLGKDIIAATQ